MLWNPGEKLITQLAMVIVSQIVVAGESLLADRQLDHSLSPV